jgi:hypothetical protein
MGKMKDKYKIAKAAKVGDGCICPSCGNKFIKENYQQAFCKTQGGTKCKDKYWNTVTPQKRNNTTRISPANAAYMANVIIPMREERYSRISTFDDGLDYLLDCGDRD